MYWKRWLKATAIRSLRTFIATLVALITSSNIEFFHDLEWWQILSKCFMAALVSFLMCLRNNLPELSEEKIDD